MLNRPAPQLPVPQCLPPCRVYPAGLRLPQRRPERKSPALALFRLDVEAGRVHETDNRLAACHTSQVFGPTTATALTAPVTSVPRPVPAITLVGTTASIPDGVAGCPARVPPNDGQCLITAYNMPGTRTSKPYFALPSVFDGISCLAMVLPISRNCESGTRAAPAAGTSSAAVAARVP